jgi:hypothetical protein
LLAELACSRSLRIRMHIHKVPLSSRTANHFTDDPHTRTSLETEEEDRRLVLAMVDRVLAFMVVALVVSLALLP